MQFNTYTLTLDRKRALCYRAKELCYEWCVEILDCEKSFRRESIEMDFEEIMSKLDCHAHVIFIHRNHPPENHLEVGFRSMTNPDYFLWIFLESTLIPQLVAEFGIEPYP